jgi:hypothetical protein
MSVGAGLAFGGSPAERPWRMTWRFRAGPRQFTLPGRFRIAIVTWIERITTAEGARPHSSRRAGSNSRPS